MVGRRSFVLGLTLTGCSRCAEGAPSPSGGNPSPKQAEPAAVPALSAMPEAGAPRGQVVMSTWSFDGGGRAVTLVPAWAKPDQRFPLLLALHGRGEANKGPIEGVMGWPRDYALVRAIQRVCAPPLTATDFETFVDTQRLALHNKALEERPFGGLVVVCPYSPDVDLRKPAQMKEYSDYVMRSVVPRARKDLPVNPAPAATGIDGVSLGGALALRIGLGNAEAFGAVGTLQPAIGEDQVGDFTALAKSARARNAAIKLRLLTSSEDYFKRAIKNLSSAWRAAGIEHDFESVPGPHDYPFNRGPGAIEMLLWHDRILAR